MTEARRVGAVYLPLPRLCRYRCWRCRFLFGSALFLFIIMSVHFHLRHIIPSGCLSHRQSLSGRLSNCHSLNGYLSGRHSLSGSWSGRHSLNGYLSGRHSPSGYLSGRHSLNGSWSGRHSPGGSLSGRHSPGGGWSGRHSPSGSWSGRHSLRHLCRRICWAVCLYGLALFMTATAAAEENSLTIGAGAAQLAVRDPVGVTAAVTAWYPEIGYRYSWSRRQSAQIHMAWMRAQTPARPGRLHTDTRGFAYSARYDYRWPWTRHFHPHFHLGLEYLDMRSRERFSVDSEGFVLERYPSRAHRRLNWLVGTSYHFEDYGWGGWVIGFDWHDPFGLSSGFAGGFRTFVRYQIRID